MHNTTSAHYGYLTCTTCHDQHLSTVYNQGGLKDTPACQSCHPDHTIPGKEFLDCIDCHMPSSVKLFNIQSDYPANMRSHMMKIWVTEFPGDSMFYVEGDYTFVKTDSGGNLVGNTLDFVCQPCHPAMSLATLYPFAENIHQEGLSVDQSKFAHAPEEFIMLRNFPNPFNASTEIEYTIPYSSSVILEIYDLQGRILNTLVDEKQSPGEHSVLFNAEQLSSGIYFCVLKTEFQTVTTKMILMK